MKRILTLIVLLALGAGGWFFWNRYQTDQPQEPVFHGNVDIREVRLGFRVGGRVMEILKEEGDSVAAGETIARLDDHPLLEVVRQAEARVRQLEASVTELRNGNRPQEIEQAVKNLAAAEAGLKDAGLQHDRLHLLVASGAVARQDYDSAKAAYDAARARRDAVQATVSLLQAGARIEQIAQAEAGLEVSRAALEQARTQLADTELTAPEAGIVLTRVLEPGSMVQSGSTVLTLSLLSPVRIRAYAPETELGKIQPGRRVLVYTDSRREPYHGQIGDVSPRAEFTPKSVETEDLRTALVYRFRIVIADADAMLRQGMPVTVRLSDN